jgi:hypothetical protein
VDRACRAASWDIPTRDIGRKLYRIARRAGFADVARQVLTKPDADGCLLRMIQTVAANRSLWHGQGRRA